MNNNKYIRIKRQVLVKIKRSNGSIQCALLRSIRPETESVSVQWQESNRNRIKVLPLTTLLQYNDFLVYEMGHLYERGIEECISKNGLDDISGKMTCVENDSDDHSTLVDCSTFQQPFNCEKEAAKSNSKPSFIPVKTMISQSTMNINANSSSHQQKNLHKSMLDVNEGQMEDYRSLSQFGDRSMDSQISLNGVEKSQPKLRVCVRKRPMSCKERIEGDVNIVEMANPGHVLVNEPRHRLDLTEFMDTQTFRFDYTFDETQSTKEVYEKTAGPLVRSMFRGAMATCFAYGQTGSGKTFTMGGPVDSQSGYAIFSEGLYGMVVSDIFEQLPLQESSSEMCVAVAFFEIYCNRVYDLLNNKNIIKVLEDATGSIQLVGLSEIHVNTVAETLLLLRQSSKLRTSGQTSANANSSRSHAIFQVNLRRLRPSDPLANKSARSGGTRSSTYGESQRTDQTRGNSEIFHSRNLIGRFSLVDLAGNERGADTVRDGDKTALYECGEINKSLLALKECIRAMGRRGHSYLPFRNSKLTQVLRESFVGSRSRTCMIAMVAPSLSCCEHTLNTLRYAHRVKQLTPLACWQRYGEMGYSRAVNGLSQQKSQKPPPISPTSSEDRTISEADTKSQVSVSLCYSSSDQSNSTWANNGIFCDTHCLRSKKLIKARETLSDLTIRHEALLHSLPKWFYLHRRILRGSTPDADSMKEYTENIIKLTTKQMKKLSNLKNTALIYREFSGLGPVETTQGGDN